MFLVAHKTFLQALTEAEALPRPTMLPVLGLSAGKAPVSEATSAEA